MTITAGCEGHDAKLARQLKETRDEYSAFEIETKRREHDFAIKIGEQERCAEDAEARNAKLVAENERLTRDQGHARHPLPQRRTHTAIRAIHNHENGMRDGLTIGLGHYVDCRLGEVFIDPDSISLAPLLRDVAILISLALQHGASIEKMRDSITRREDGTTPVSIIGSSIDAVAGENKQGAR
jgi:hypothetical protein